MVRFKLSEAGWRCPGGGFPKAGRCWVMKAAIVFDVEAWDIGPGQAGYWDEGLYIRRGAMGRFDNTQSGCAGEGADGETNLRHSLLQVPTISASADDLILGSCGSSLNYTAYSACCARPEMASQHNTRADVTATSSLSMSVTRDRPAIPAVRELMAQNYIVENFSASLHLGSDVLARPGWSAQLPSGHQSSQSNVCTYSRVATFGLTRAPELMTFSTL